MSAEQSKPEDLTADLSPEELQARIARLRKSDPGSYVAAIARLIRDLDD